MDAVNVLMFLLVCAFTSVGDSLKITCENVTGYLGNELTLTCRVSDPSDKCCIKNYKFINKTDTCQINFEKDPCKQLAIIPCLYPAKKVMTSTFKFFIQTNCGAKSAEFTVNITEDSMKKYEIFDTNAAEPTTKPETMRQQDNTMPLAVAILAICAVIMAVVGVILQRKYNCLNVLQRGNNLSQCEENNTPEESHPLEEKHPPEHPQTEEV